MRAGHPPDHALPRPVRHRGGTRPLPVRRSRGVGLHGHRGAQPALGPPSPPTHATRAGIHAPPPYPSTSPVAPPVCCLKSPPPSASARAPWCAAACGCGTPRARTAGTNKIQRCTSGSRSACPPAQWTRRTRRSTTPHRLPGGWRAYAQRWHWPRSLWPLRPRPRTPTPRQRRTARCSLPRPRVPSQSSHPHSRWAPRRQETPLQTPAVERGPAWPEARRQSKALTTHGGWWQSGVAPCVPEGGEKGKRGGTSSGGARGAREPRTSSSPPWSSYCEVPYRPGEAGESS